MIKNTIRNSRGLRYLVVATVAILLVAPATAVAVPSPPHEVFGTVTDRNGDPVEDITVEVAYNGNAVESAQTGADGYYEIKVPDPDSSAQEESITVSVKGQTESTTWVSAESERIDLQVSTPGGGSPGESPDTPTAEPGSGNTGGNNNGGSSSGGGGGGAVSGPSVVSGSVDVGADGRASVDLSGGKAVESVDVELPAGVSGSVSVDELEDLPEGVSETHGKRIALVDLHAPDPGDGTAVVRLSVSKRVVDAYRAAPEELTVEHYDADAGEWETLDTSVASTSDDRVVLEAETSGFSLYAVTEGGSAAVTTTATTTAVPEESTDEPTATTATPAPSTDEPTTDEPNTTTRPFPGFGPVVALVALLAVALLARRRE